MNNNNLSNKVNDIDEKVQEIVKQKMNDFYAADLEQEATLEEIEQIYSSVELRKLLRNERKKTLRVLNEAVDALGDIPADDCTKQQKNACALCVETRDNLLDTKKEVKK